MKEENNIIKGSIKIIPEEILLSEIQGKVLWWEEEKQEKE